MKTLKEMKQTMKMDDFSMSTLSKIEQKNIIAGSTGTGLFKSISADCSKHGYNCGTISGLSNWLTAEWD